MRTIGMEFDIIPFKKFQNNHKLDGPAQLFFTQKIYEFSEPYTPMSSNSDSSDGMLYTNVDIEEDYIHYKSPYANYLWNGNKFVDPKYKIGAFYSEDYGFWSRPNILKEETSIPLEYSGAPLRGPEWLNRMWADKSGEICDEVQKFLDGGK